jgi:hypothetical protein
VLINIKVEEQEAARNESDIEMDEEHPPHRQSPLLLIDDGEAQQQRQTVAHEDDATDVTPQQGEKQSSFVRFVVLV